MAFLNLTIQDLSEKLKKREVSSEEVTREVISHTEKTSNTYNAFITKTFDLALEQAKAVDTQRLRGDDLGPLAGIPMSIKDVIVTKGIRTTAGSKILEKYTPPYTATVAKKLGDAGMVLLGKNNCDEFAMGASNEKSAYGAVKNPWDEARVPGGSSGGSAAAVASGQGYYSVGSDTGGSVRQPASFCGIVGMKPSYGRVSRYGLMALCSSFDQIGPLTRNVYDNALVMNAIAGPDLKDSTTYPKPAPDYTKTFDTTLEHLKVGVPKDFFIEGMDKGVREAVEKAIQKIDELGADIIEVELPLASYSIAVYYTILPCEASSNLARYDGMRFGSRDLSTAKALIDSYFETRGIGFGKEVKRRIMIGAHALSSGYYDAYYLKAQKVRAAIKQEFDDVFERVDCLLAPTTPRPAFKIGDNSSSPLTMYLEDIFTAPANIAGLCALSLPCGLSSGLPVGLQIIGNQFDEEIIYRVAYHYEQASGWKGLEI